MDAAETPLKVNPADPQISPNTKRAASAEATALLDRAGAAIAELEQSVREVPEILRLPGPGQGDTGQKASQFEARWRSTLQKQRDRLAKLREKATKLGK
jgi:hypothetical protein